MPDGYVSVWGGEKVLELGRDDRRTALMPLNCTR